MARVSIYVVYRDGWPEYMGTARQCAEHYGVKVETVRFYATPAKSRRSKDADSGIVVVKAGTVDKREAGMYG